MGREARGKGAGRAGGDGQRGAHEGEGAGVVLRSSRGCGLLGDCVVRCGSVHRTFEKDRKCVAAGSRGVLIF